MVTETDIELTDGHTLHVYDTAADADLVVFWHHGTPNTGEPPAPLLPASAERGIRWVSYDRPGYGGSTPRRGRHIGSAAADVAGIADALGIERFAVMGHSGGATHALASGALLTDRVVAVVALSAMAPFNAEGLDWFAGMAAPGTLRAAVEGRAAVADYLASTEFDPDQFIPADFAALEGEWAWMGKVAGQAVAGGLEGQIEDELSYVAPWGFSVEQITAPTLFVYGERDRVAPSSYGPWFVQHIPSAELWLRPDDGHISILSSGEAALDWLKEHAKNRP